MINILCSSKPGDGLFCYSYEHCHYLNSIGISSQVVVITHNKFSQQDYLNNIKEKYITPYAPVIFDEYTPKSNEITLIMGRSMLTLPYINRKDYNSEQLLTMHLLFGNNLISVYSENHLLEYPLAIKYFNANKVHDLCDYEVYPEGVGQIFEKMINFSIYKPVVEDIQFDYLFLGTNPTYYNKIRNIIHNYPSHGILTYNEEYIDNNYNNVFAPVKNLLGLFKSYVYTKTYFDPAPRLIKECQWLGKEVVYERSRNRKDGGIIYWNRPVPTEQMYSENINILVEVIKEINEKINS